MAILSRADVKSLEIADGTYDVCLVDIGDLTDTIEAVATSRTALEAWTTAVKPIFGEVHWTNQHMIGKAIELTKAAGVEVDSDCK